MVTSGKDVDDIMMMMIMMTKALQYYTGVSIRQTAQVIASTCCLFLSSCCDSDLGGHNDDNGAVDENK